MTEWLVGFRDVSTIDHSLVTAASAIDAADAVPSVRPGVPIAAVFNHSEPTSYSDRSEYSDLPRSYRELGRYNGPAGGPHGYLVVTIGVDGSRGVVPTRPISLEQARWHRDWMLRGYFNSVEQYLRNPRWTILPQLPVIVRLDPVDEEPVDEEPVDE